MKVLVGSFQCESNTFCNTKATWEDFEVIQGIDVMNRLAASKIFIDEGFELVPSIFASALPSGEVKKEVFETVKSRILKTIDENPDINAIYLYLHGSMCVENIGSGEEALLTAIRDKIGNNILIGVALDFHANNTIKFIKNVNIVYGFRTAPHTDHDETEIRVARAICKCLKNCCIPKTVMVKAPVLMADAATTDKPPLKDMMEMLKLLDNNDDIVSAAVFNGQPWVDYDYVGPSVVLSYINNKEFAAESAKAIAKVHWDGRKRFKFDVLALEPRAAIEKAMLSDMFPIFVTDSGDNTTAGADGEGTLMLKNVLDCNALNTLVCGITDKNTTDSLLKKNIGDKVEVVIGKNSKESIIIPIIIKGELLGRGKVIGWANEYAGDGVLIRTKGIDIILTNIRAAFISPEHIESFGVNPMDYKIIVIKMGYLFPKLSKIAAGSIFALTPGKTTNVLETLDYKRILRPIYPLVKDFEWLPEQLI